MPSVRRVGTLRKMTALPEGSRIELVDYADRFPFFLVPPGAKGTVTEVSDNVVCIKMDEHIDGCEGWDNEVIYNLPEYEEELRSAVKVIS